MTLWNGAVHPAADAFPMLDDERLAALAEGIKTGGLRNPGWLTPDGTLIDGRNRRRACELAGVEMRWEIYRGDDIVSFIVHQNVDRRDLTAGQRAAIACDLIPLYEHEALQRKAAAGRSSAPGKKAEKDSMNSCYLSPFPDLPEDQSTAAAKAPKASAGKTAGVVAELTHTSQDSVEKFKALQASAPDLADQVRAGELSLNAAKQEVAKRAKADQVADPIALLTFDELTLLEQIRAGNTIVVNMRDGSHARLWAYAEAEGLAVRIDRKSEWGNPFVLDEDGTRDQVCDLYANVYWPHKISLHAKVSALQGKALGCWCAPARCHGDHLKAVAST